jgi:hypothetical protein
MIPDPEFDLLTPRPQRYVALLPDASQTVELNLREIRRLLVMAIGAAGDLYMGFSHKGDDDRTAHAKCLMESLVELERKAKEAEGVAFQCRMT